MAAGLEPLVVFWSGRGIHITVVLSFAVQVTLLLLADLRRRADWPVLKVSIWSAYMLADTTAIYALGHLSVVVRSPEHHLMALWAPLLLVHLGGQDNITAYAIEDNRLWLRHLQTFGVQLLAAGYVLYTSSILSRPSLLRSAAILMSVVGVLKYGERVWALIGADRSASGSLSATSYKDLNAEQTNDGDTSQRNEVKLNGLSSGPARQSNEVDLEGCPAGSTSHGHGVDPEDLSEILASESHEVEEGVEMGQGVMSTGPPRQGDKFEGLVTAYSLLDVAKQMFEGPTRFVKIRKARRYEGEFMLEVVEMQLTMMYDLLYTKAVVVHTWFGFLVRVLSLPFTVAALLLFHGPCSPCGRLRCCMNGNGISLAVWFNLLSWWFIWPVMLLVGKEGYWSRSMRQHHLFKVLLHSKCNRSSRIAKRMGWEDLWGSTFYSWSIRVPGAIIDKVLELVSTTEANQIDITDSRGRNAMRRRNLSLGEDLAWSVGLDLDESILVWHIATHFYLEWYFNNILREDYSEVIESLEARLRIWELYKATEALCNCNYMFFMLRYVQLCHDSIIHVRFFMVSKLLGAIVDQKEPLLEGSPLQPDHARGIIGVPPCTRTIQKSVNSTTGDRGTPQPSMNCTLDKGCQLAAKLIHTADGPDAGKRSALGILKMIFEVWVEMLCYTAYWCNEKSHAKNLTNGGELMTIVALMMVYTSNGFIKKTKKQSGAPFF
ncbi:hypothetical protein VPH35_041768 [Triticum aestivum]